MFFVVHIYFTPRAELLLYVDYFNCVCKPIKVSSNKIIPSAKSIVNTSMNSG